MQPAHFALGRTNAVLLLPGHACTHARLYRVQHTRLVLGVDVVHEVHLEPGQRLRRHAMHGKKSGAGIGHDEPAVRDHAHLKQPPGHLLRQAPKAALLLHAQPIAALALQRSQTITNDPRTMQAEPTALRSTLRAMISSAEANAVPRSSPVLTMAGYPSTRRQAYSRSVPSTAATAS